MEKKEEVKIRKSLKEMKKLTVIFAVFVVIGGIVLAGIVMDHLLKGAPGGEIEISDKRVEAVKSFIGAQITAIDEAISKQLGLDTSGGLLVSSVVEDSPAEAAGLMRGDLIMRFDRQQVTGIQQFQNLVAATAPGDVAKMVVKRAGMDKSLYIKIGGASNEELTLIAASPGDLSAGGTGAKARTAQSSSSLSTQDRDRTRDPLLSIAGKPETDDSWDISISPVTPDISQKYGLAARKGVVVSGVQPGGAGAVAGLKPGDLIISVNKTETPDVSAFYTAISGVADVLLDVFSQGEEKYITMQVDPQEPPTATLGVQVTKETGRKIAIAAAGPALSDGISPRFGTAAYFLIVDPQKPALIKAIPNLNIQNDARGYGILAAQLVIQEKVESVITAFIGPQAFDALSLYGIKIYCGTCQFTGNSGEAALAYSDGKLIEITAPNISGTGYSRGLSALPVSPVGGQTSYTLTQGGPPTLTQGQPQGTANQVTACVCPVCGYTEQHQIGVPCYATTCPKCGSIMVRADRLISLAGGTTSGGKPVTYAPIQQTGGKPEDIPPVGRPDTIGGGAQPVYLLVQGGPPNQLPASAPVAYAPVQLTGGKPEDIPPVSYLPVQLTAGKPVSYAPVGGTTSGGKPVSYAPIAGMPTSGKPENIPPVSYTTTSDSTQLGVCVDMCVCPQCGFTVEHPEGIACNTISCPKCGSALMSATKIISLTGGKPEDIPPVGKPAAYTPVQQTGGKPDDIPPVSYTLISRNPGSEEEADADEEEDGFKGKPIQVPLMGKREDVESNIINIYQVAGPPPQVGNIDQIASPQSLFPGLALPGDKGGAANTGRASFIPVQGMPQTAVAPADNPGTVWVNTCYCPLCRITVPRPVGMPCAAMTCPNCGGKLVNTTAGNTGSGNSPVNRTAPAITQLPTQQVPTLQNTVPNTAVPSGQSVVNVSLPVPKVAVAVDKKKITSDIAPLFDNAKYFLILGYGGYEFISNPNAKDKTGSGVQTAQFLVGEGVSVVIVNNISLEALKALKDLKVTVYSGLSGTAQQAVAWYQEGRLEATVLKDDEANHDSSESSRGKGPREDKQKGETTKAVF